MRQNADPLQKLHAIQHLLRDENLSDQHRASNEEPNARLGWREEDAGVRDFSGVQSQMIGVCGNQHSALHRRHSEERGVGNPELLRLPCC